jgi:precorrin-8X/cobalt-precorrin-8 methylmutase
LTLFDSFLTVDWSAAATPAIGRDSVWLHLGVRRGRRLETRRLSNPATRTDAIAEIAGLMADEVAAGRRLLAGFDFPFGYPRGTAAALGLDPPDWRGLWRALADGIADGPANANNRFAFAAAWNRKFPDGRGPFWGRPERPPVPGLPTRKPADAVLPERRRCDARVPGAQPVWKLYTTGSVGGQALMGIAALERLRRRPELAAHLAVWPFESGLAGPPAGKPILLAEVYPSLVEPAGWAGLPKDAGQVVAIGRHLAARDANGALACDLAGPTDLGADERLAVTAEEAWIVGAGTFARPAPPPRDPAGIYALSWERVRAATDLDGLPAELHPIALRLVHTAGDPTVIHGLDADPRAVAAAQAALAAGRPILVDAAMVQAGVTRRLLPAANPVRCALSDDLVARPGETRSAAAVDRWTDAELDGAVVAIGNAPTALERLLDRVKRGGPRPAVVLGFCVGFVGAVEAKRRLAGQRRVPWIVLTGRRGGSALAAAAINALAAPKGAPEAP